VTHVRGGVVFAVNGQARGDLEAPIDAKIDESAAAEAATVEGGRLADLSVSKEFGLAYRQVGEKLHLIYTVDIFGTQKDGTPVHDTVHVSAEDGSILARIPHIHTAENREMHDMKHASTISTNPNINPVVRAESGAALTSNVNNDPINNNYDRLGSVYDAYKTLFNRDSYNNLGAKLLSQVHYSTNYVNAYWDGVQMVYGDGDGVNASNLANSMDVTGHELTHAVPRQHRTSRIRASRAA
jgi:vibriolysin